MGGAVVVRNAECGQGFVDERAVSTHVVSVGHCRRTCQSTRRTISVGAAGALCVKLLGRR